MNHKQGPVSVDFSKKFKRDLAKLGAEVIVSHRFSEVIHCLLNGVPLPEVYKDHKLEGALEGCRDCHIFNDLVLIYRLDNGILSFLRVGTHSELFG